MLKVVVIKNPCTDPLLEISCQKTLIDSELMYKLLFGLHVSCPEGFPASGHAGRAVRTGQNPRAVLVHGGS
jgi:hypothetical protein